MENKKLEQSITELAVAALISEGEFEESQSTELAIKVPLVRKKAMYLVDIINNAKLKPFVEINLKKEQMTIHSHPVLREIKTQWYQKNTKIFSMILDPKLITPVSILTCINLFGTRKSETISIPTTIAKDYIKTIAYCIEHHLNVPIIPSGNQIKISNVPDLILNTINDIPAIHSAELMNFLTEKEKKEIMEGVLV